MEGSMQGYGSKFYPARCQKMLSTFQKSIKCIRIPVVAQKNYGQKHFKVLPLDNKPQGRLFDFRVASVNI